MEIRRGGKMNNSMRRGRARPLFLALLAAATAFASLAACSRRQDDAKVLRVALRAGPISLDPRIASDAVGDKIAHLISDGLLKKDEHLDMVPNLAARYEQISDTSYRFFLRPGVKFHDGEPLDAGDVVYTFRSIIDGEVVSLYKSAFEHIDEIVAEDPLTVRIDLKGPYAPFLVMLNRGIVSEKAARALGDEFGQRPVGTGPYRFVRHVTDSVVELEANPDYFGGAPKIPRLEFQIIKDDNIRVLKLLKGDVDLVQNGIPPMLIERVLASPGMEKTEDTGIVVTYMGFNLTDPVVGKKEVRRAIAHAIDRDQIISHRWQGLAVKASSILSLDNWAYDEGLKQYEYDPALAARLLDEAGFPDPDGGGPKKRFVISYKTSTDKERVDIARMIAHQLGKVGIDMKVEPYEWGTFYNDVKRGNFQTYTLSWVGVTEPDFFYDVCHSSQMPPDGLNRSRFANRTVDRLVEVGRVTMDRGKRKKIYDMVQEIVLDELPYIPLWYEKNVVVYNRRLAGVSLRPDASFSTFVDIEKK